MLSIGKVCTVLLLFSGLVCGCPTWYTNITGHCECGATIGERIKCHTDEERVDIRAGYCMTFDYKMKSALSGSCPYGYIHSNMTNRVYAALPKDPTQLNETTCGPYYREGLLCAHCIEGFGPAIYISDLACVNCSDISRGSAIILYLVLEFVPITLFYFVVVILHLNITSGPMLGYIIFCQMGAFADVRYATFMTNSIQSHLPHYLVTLYHVSTVLSEVWSLNFWGALPPFCLSDRITGIHLRMLSFLPAVYVVILMATTCTGIELHKRNYRVVRCLWKPFGLCFLVFQKQWSASDSVIHAFATFIMLSSFTLTFDTLSLFHFTVVRNVNDTAVKHVLYYDPSIVAYGTEHIVYLGAAIIIFFLLALFPALLLCLYPTRVYEKLSRCCSPRKRLAVKIFAEALHNCFKNGLNGTRDYRSLAGVVVMAPVPAILGLFVKCLRPLPLFTSVVAVMFLFISFSISYIRPCKSLIMNASLSFHSTLLGIMCFEYALWTESSSFSSDVLAPAFVVVPAVPHCLILIWAGYKFICFSHCGYCIRRLLRRAALSLSRKRDYEELCDTLMHNQ